MRTRRTAAVAKRVTSVGRRAALAGLSAAVGACGGGVPLLYPARALEARDVRVSGGASGTLAVGPLANDVAAARAMQPSGPPGPGPPGSNPTFAKGVLTLAAVAPGVAPYVGVRVGLGDRFEAGATYTGRAAHLDVRRSFDSNDVSLSVGLGLEMPVYGDTDATTLPGINLASVSGFGADVPVLVGWQSSARAYMVWGGVRAGWDYINVSSASQEPQGTLGVSANRLYGAGVVGLAAGFRHVHVALELDVAYQSVVGSFDGSNVTVRGLSMAPAAALWFSF